MRKACLQSVYELAKLDERIFFIGSDLGPGTLREFQQDMPDRFFMEGINEANIIGMAAGLALSGKIVYVNTIATFITRRCYEQIALDLCLHHANVRLIGNGGGVVYGPLGPTHQAIEDISLMRGLPNMTVLAPADASEMTRLMPATVDHPGPMYIRLAKGGDEIVTGDIENRTIGEAECLREGQDVLLVTTGITLQIALQAADKLLSSNITTTVLHYPTLKPFDKVALLAHVKDKRSLLVLEEHVPVGGLASAVTDLLCENKLDGQVNFGRIGLPDKFLGEYGSQAEIMAKYGLSVSGVIEKLKMMTAGSR